MTASAERETLAIVMMTRNEQTRLPACLERVSNWADEIVIIDDNSTDRTVEIAQQYGAKVFAYACEDDHCRQWNRGIDHASSDWILHIDADEWVTPGLKEALAAMLREPSPYSAFEIMRKNVFIGHPMLHGGWYHKHLVLFRRDKARCIGSGIHSGARLRVDGSIGFMPADVEHFPFDSLSQYIARQNHYTSVEAQALIREKGSIKQNRVVAQMAWKPWKVFQKRYFKQKGHKDGWHGFAFAVLAAFMHFVLWAKYWEAKELGYAKA